jgi:hypothetical protein
MFCELFVFVCAFGCMCLHEKVLDPKPAQARQQNRLCEVQGYEEGGELRHVCGSCLVILRPPRVLASIAFLQHLCLFKVSKEG